MTSQSFPEMFERVLVPAIFLPWADDLIDRTQPSPRERVLDVGCGTGIVARRVRQRCGGDTRITGVDLNPEMVALARSLAPDIEWRQGNALDLPFANASFDLGLSQEALQFFPDRMAGAREMRRVLSEPGRIALSTWRPLEENPLYDALNKLAAAHFGPQVDRRFSLGDADEIRAILAGADFRDVQIETVSRIECMPNPDTFIMMNLNATVDLDEIDAARRAEAVANFQTEARKAVAAFLVGDALVHPTRANVAIARV